MTNTPDKQGEAPERIWINNPAEVTEHNQRWWYENPMAFPTVEYVRVAAVEGDAEPLRNRVIDEWHRACHVNANIEPRETFDFQRLATVLFEVVDLLRPAAASSSAPPHDGFHPAEDVYEATKEFWPVGGKAQQRPRIICLCGSTRFIEQFAITTWELEREGYIVLGCTLLPMWYCNTPSHFGEATGTKEQCDELHKRKIDLADEVLVLNIGGYIGESTRSEIEYATRLGKPVRYIETEDAAALRTQENQ